jgi:hypothetical protein
MPRGTEIGALGTKLWHRSPPFRCSVRHPLESIMTSEPLQSHPSRARLRHLYPAPIGPESIIKNFLSKYGGYYPNDYHIELVINSNPSIQYDVNSGALFGDNRRKHGKVESRNKPCYRRLGEAMLTHDNYSSYT